MKKLALALLMTTAIIGGCQWLGKALLHVRSGLVGLDRTITLYDAEGGAIRAWHVKGYVELQGGTASWQNDDGREVKISGAYVIEQDR